MRVRVSSRSRFESGESPKVAVLKRRKESVSEGSVSLTAIYIRDSGLNLSNELAQFRNRCLGRCNRSHRGQYLIDLFGHLEGSGEE